MTETFRKSWPAGRIETMDVVLTQANAGGGAIVVDVTPGSGNEFTLLGAELINSGTNGLAARRTTGATPDNCEPYAAIGSGAGTACALPGPGTAATSTGNVAASTNAYFTGTDSLTFAQTAAGAQNDTLTVRAIIRVRGATPTLSIARSTNAVNVAVTSGALAFAPP